MIKSHTYASASIALSILARKSRNVHTKGLVTQKAGCRGGQRSVPAAGSDLCPRREGLQTVLRKTASSPSNRRRADVR